MRGALRSHARRALPGIAIVLGAFAAASRLAAAAAAPSAAPPTPVLLLVPRGQEAWLGRGEAFRAQLSDLPVALRVQPVGPLPVALAEQLALARGAAGAGRPTGAGVVIWLDRAGATELLLLVADPAAPRVTVRRIPGAPEGPAGPATIEAAAVAARSQVRGLLGDATAAAPAPAPDPADAGPPRQPLTLRAGYALEAWSAEARFHAVELRAEVRPLPWLAVAAGTRVGPGVRIPGARGDLSVERFPWSLEVGWVAPLGRRLRLELAAGPAFELVRARPDPLPEGWALRPRGATVLFGATASARLDVRIAGGLHVTLGLGLDALFPETTWSVRSSDPAGALREALARPWAVRPRALVALALDAP
jgi:hypothetical protein